MMGGFQKNRDKIVLVGNPNVGKSLLFNQLSHTYAVVSNYPGTTVEISRGRAVIKGRPVEIIDTPGMYSFLPITEEERAAQSLLFSTRGALILHVVDAKNLPRHLPLTLQLLEGGFRVLLVVNMLDEAEKAGISLNLEGLSQRLGIPVVGTVLIRRQGVSALKKALLDQLVSPHPSPRQPVYPPDLEEPLGRLSSRLKGSYPLSLRMAALLLLCGDEKIRKKVRRAEGDRGERILREAALEEAKIKPSAAYLAARGRHEEARRLLQGIFTARPQKGTWSPAGLLIEPLTGIPFLFLVVYFGLYKFVGGFGAGYLVNLLDSQLFDAFLIPQVDRLALTYLPGGLLPRLLALEYGLITMGFRYAAAIVLPIVGTFFFFFAFLEDSGYLPRLALLADKLLKKLGLSGRAVIPLALGLGCGTMAVIVTRTLESRRERIIASFLLALAIPCSAQLGLFFGILSGFPPGLLLWLGVVLLCLVSAGFLADRFMPGEKTGFYLELPPLRFPSLTNIAVKTWSRMSWYFKEVLPVFLLISLVLSVSHYVGLLGLMVEMLSPAMALLGLPEEMALVFFLGFFRRDYGAAGLFDLTARGLLDPLSLVVAAVTLTLFLPCMAQMAVLFRERGAWTTLSIIFLVGGIALGAGLLLRLIFLTAGLQEVALWG